MDEKHYYAMIERMQRMLEHLEEIEENLEPISTEVVTVDRTGKHVFKDSDEMAEYYAKRMQ